jgi:futalosine hydrolase
MSRGVLRDRSVWLLESGLGAVNTAHALTCALQADRPALVLQAGVGGAYATAGLAVGDLAVATEENYGDLGVRTPEGWQSAAITGIPVLQVGERQYFNRFPLEEGLVASARKALEGSSWSDGESALAAGPFVTVQECSGTAQLGSERAALFAGAVCENMEGAAAAHICRLYGIPFLEVRAISNLVEDRRRETWDLPLAAARAQRAAVHLVAELEP